MKIVAPFWQLIFPLLFITFMFGCQAEKPVVEAPPETDPVDELASSLSTSKDANKSDSERNISGKNNAEEVQSKVTLSNESKIKGALPGETTTIADESAPAAEKPINVPLAKREVESMKKLSEVSEKLNRPTDSRSVRQLTTNMKSALGLAKNGQGVPVTEFARTRAANTPVPSGPTATFEDSSGLNPGEGKGPGIGGDKFDSIVENPFISVSDEPLSTFSIDVDTASYSKVRSYLMDHHQMPPQGAVRVEEMVNYFNYDYQAPTDEHPFAANVEVAACPWNQDHRLVRVGLKGEEIENEDRPASNLVFLIDVSGSMRSPKKLPLLKQGMKMLVDQLGENDSVAIVVYASATGLVLDATSGDRKAEIISSLDSLEAGGSTNGGAGMQLAYKVALEHFIKGGTNRVILCTDGDFNVGVTSTDGIVGFAEEQAKAGVFLSVLGFGTGNLNDSMMEQLSNKANGNYAFIDSTKEAKKVLVEQMSGTLLTIAKDVKIQIEFNPKKVASYRLVGYENRILAAQDFNDDKKDAGEIGAGHTVTAFYEVVPVGVEADSNDPKVDPLKYQTDRKTTKAAKSDELMTLKLRYKKPDEDTSTLMTYPVADAGKSFNQSSSDFQFASAVAMFAMAINDSKHANATNFEEILELASSNLGEKPSSYREEFVKIVSQAKSLK